MTSTEINEAEFDFATGTEEAKKEAAKNRPIFADQLLRPSFLSFKKEDPKHMVRFLDDERENENDRRQNLFIGVQEHSFVRTVPQPESFEGENWRADMGAVCRRDRAFKKHYPQGCYICDNNLPKADSKKGEFAAPSQRLYARVVLREKFVWSQDDADAGRCPAEMVGKKGIRDMLKEVAQVGKDGKATGEKLWVPDVRLLAGAQKTLFSHLTGLAQAHYDEDDVFTILHCDWRINRTGFTANDTAYTITAVPGSDALAAGDFATSDYPYWDVNNPAIYDYYTKQVPWTLRGHLIRNASDEHFDRWFIPGGWDKWEKKREADRKAAEGSTKAQGSTIEDDEDEAPGGVPSKTPAQPESPAPTATASDSGGTALDDEDDDEDATPSESRLSALKDKTQRRMSAGPAPARNASVDEDDDEFESVGG